MVFWSKISAAPPAGSPTIKQGYACFAKKFLNLKINDHLIFLKCYLGQKFLQRLRLEVLQ